MFHIETLTSYQIQVLLNTTNAKEAASWRPAIGLSSRHLWNQKIVSKLVTVHPKPSCLLENEEQASGSLKALLPEAKACRIIYRQTISECLVTGGYFAFVRLIPNRNHFFENDFLMWHHSIKNNVEIGCAGQWPFIRPPKMPFPCTIAFFWFVSFRLQKTFLGE